MIAATKLKWLRIRELLLSSMKSNAIAGPRQFSVAEAALYLEIHSQTVYELVAAKPKQIRSRRKGRRKGRIFFLQCDLDDYLDN